MRAASKGTGWRSSQGSVFREYRGWFVYVHPVVYINQNTTKASVWVKPMAIDPIFWDLVVLPENNAQPLSFRWNGAWTCQPPEFAEIDLPEEHGVEAVARRLLMVANEQLKAVADGWSVEAFLEMCRERSRGRDAYLACVVTALISLGRENDALAACEAAEAAGWIGGFMSPEGTFVEMAARWLQQRSGSSTRH